MTLDLPTPPLPEAIAYTRVSEPGLEKGISRSALPAPQLRLESFTLFVGHDAEVDHDVLDPVERADRGLDVLRQGRLHGTAGHGEQTG